MRMEIVKWTQHLSSFESLKSFSRAFDVDGAHPVAESRELTAKWNARSKSPDELRRSGA